MDRQGLTIVPLSLYFRRGMVKVELGVAKGKKLYDKRESLRKKEDQRSMAREGRRDR
jgi:SsrA-binding protein